MAFDLKQKNALITGSTGKLTHHLVRQLATMGVNLALHYNANEALADQLRQTAQATGCFCKTYRTDLVDPRQTQTLAQNVLADFGHVDILVNAASIFEFRKLADSDDQFWQTTLDVNLSAPFRLIRALQQNFHSRDGAILNFADIWGLCPRPSILTYSVAKAGLIALTKALALEFAPATTVNAIAPGLIDIPAEISDAQRQSLYQRIPMNRTGQPGEVVDFALAILTNRYVTGQIFTVDGGRSLI